MEDAPVNGIELSHSAHATGMNELDNLFSTMLQHIKRTQLPDSDA